MIYYSIPWNSDKNIGEYYNDFMRKLDDEDFGCFIDYDAMFTTSTYGKQLEDIIKKYPDCGLFTCLTNRIGCRWQRFGSWDENDINKHRDIGDSLQRLCYSEVQDVSDKPQFEAMGGVMIMIRKSTWRSIGQFKEDGILGVDNDIYWKAQRADQKIYLMKGVYVYHWYRNGDSERVEHLIGAKDGIS